MINHQFFLFFILFPYCFPIILNLFSDHSSIIYLRFGNKFYDYNKKKTKSTKSKFGEILNL